MWRHMVELIKKEKLEWTAAGKNFLHEKCVPMIEIEDDFKVKGEKWNGSFDFWGFFPEKC